jgi:hypothetical protein
MEMVRDADVAVDLDRGSGTGVVITGHATGEAAADPARRHHRNARAELVLGSGVGLGECGRRPARHDQADAHAEITASVATHVNS